MQTILFRHLAIASLVTGGTLLAGYTQAAAVPVVLVKTGTPVAAIVTAKAATKSAQLAAHEVQFHIWKITGVTLPILTEDDPAPSTRILVGESVSTVALGLKSSNFAPQEYAISFLPRTVILIGRDKHDTGPVDYQKGTGFPDLFDEQGTMYAAYDFLERFCGIRWYLPTDLGITCTPRKTLVVKGTNVRRAPVVKKRFADPAYRIPSDLCGDTVRDGTPVPPLDRREILLWHLRHRIGGRPHAVNHSFYGYYDRFLKDHPTWFAQGYDGIRPPQLCYTNPEVIAQVVQDARDYFDGKGIKPGAVAAGDYFALVPMDNSQWCRCPACQAWLTGGAVRGKGQFSNDSASNYIFHFVNCVAREIAKSHPSKKIAVLGYASYCYPPTAEPLERNVDVTLCLHTRTWYNPAIRNNDLAILQEWQTTGLPLGLWMYYCFPVLSATQGNYRVFPPFFGHEIVKQMPIFLKAGVQGMSYEPSYLVGSQKSPLLDQVEFFVTWRLADNPDCDGNQLIAEFFDRYYGAAARPMRAFYEMAEKIFWDPANHPPGISGPEVEWGYLGTEERMKKLGDLMAEARFLARTDLEKQRVALFEKGIWQYMVKGRESYLEMSRVPLKSADVPRTNPPPGRDPAGLDWSKAAILTDWKGIDGRPRADKRDLRLEGRILHDGTNLYLRLQDLTPPKDLVDRGGIWDDDEYEIFFGDQRGPAYHQIGVTFQERYETYRWPGPKPWDSGVQVSSDCTQPDRWILYLVFPLDRLTPQGVVPGRTFYMNVIRSLKTNDAMAWNPTLGGYHAPNRMGAITLR